MIDRRSPVAGCPGTGTIAYRSGIEPISMPDLEDTELLPGTVPIDLAPVGACPERIRLAALQGLQEVIRVFPGMFQLRTDLVLDVGLLVTKPLLDFWMEQYISLRRGLL